jgi:putative membrane protein
MAMRTQGPDEPPVTPTGSAAPIAAPDPATSDPVGTAGPPTGTVASDRPAAAAERLRSTRASRAWIKILPAVVVLAVILDFVFQNLHDTKVRFITLSGTVALALALLIATALGALLVLALGSIRIIQLRKVVHTYRKAEADRDVPPNP